jgi:hypothetical protein
MASTGAVLGSTAAGAGAGAAFGPYGAAIGAGVGFVGGMLSGDGGKPVGPVSPVYGSYQTWGRDPYAAGNYYNFGMQNAGQQDALGKDSYMQGNTLRLPTVYENQELSDREAASRGWDQSGALQLSREAAMGEAPSQAAYQMQHGLDQALASQQAQAGSARGASGIALAQSNAMGNSAALQNQTYNQMAALRAQEMASARGLYGGLAGQMRDQDLQRLNMGNQVSGLNAQLGQDMQKAYLGLTPQFYGLGANYYGNAANAYNSQLGADVAVGTGNTNAANMANQINMGGQQFNSNLANQQQAQNMSMIGTGMTAGAQGINSYMSRPKTGISGTSTTTTTTQPKQTSGVYSDPNHMF